MFCKHCGADVAEDAKFCPECGGTLAGSADSSGGGATATAAAPDTSEPVLTLQPVFIPWVVILATLPGAVFFALWAGLFLGGFSGVAIDALGLNISPVAPGVFFAALALVGIPGVTYYAKRSTYADTEYKFFPDRLEYAEGFWAAEQKMIPYEKITEVSMRSGIIQRMYGLGTIYLATPATGSMNQGSKSFSGIKLRDIPDAQDVYGRVRQVLNA